MTTHPSLDLPDPSRRVSVVDVAIDPKTAGSGGLYSYLPIPGIEVGSAVEIALGNRRMLGFVVAQRDVTEPELGFPISALKPVSELIDGLSIPAPLVRTIHFISSQYLAPIPVSLSPAIPPGIQDRIVTTWRLTGAAEKKKLTVVQQEILRTLADMENGLEDSKTKPIEPGILKSLKALRAEGLVKQSLRLKESRATRQLDLTYALTPESAAVEKFLRDEGRKKPAQAVVLMQMQLAEGAAFSSAEIRAMAGVTETTVKALVKSQLLIAVDLEDRRTHQKPPPQPNEFQQVAIDAISTSVANRTARPFLLYGVTGSGKTEVFLRSAARALQAGRQVLYLVPEIALATQAIAQLRDRFGSNVAIIHSELSAGERLSNWIKIRNGEAAIVLGARSALFAPLSNIGLIIMDEEHEGGYKQESAPRYHARTVARQLSAEHRCPIVLGSATPSVETFFEAEKNESVGSEDQLALLTLPSRAASAKLPTVHIEDLTLGYRPGGSPGLLSPSLSEKLTETLEAGNQAILFLNRRAYAPFLNCRTCGHDWKCPSCAVSLAYHRRENKLKCHHCGLHIPYPVECPTCGGVKIKPFGVGTEKVEESLRLMYPEARVGRLDRDVVAKKGMLEQTLADFRSGEINVLVGTQLVAKGLDFPNVTLVGVIAADISLNLPDFRATERTFQLLTQVAGRAGRGTKPGEVVIQTFHPDAIAIEATRRQSYAMVYESLVGERLLAEYPPFSRLVNIVLSSESFSVVVAKGTQIAQALREFEHFQILGPADCPLEKLKNLYRRHLLIKYPSGADLSPIQMICDSAAEKSVQIVIDVDPYNLM